MANKLSPFTRRSFLKTTLAAAAGTASLPLASYEFRPAQNAR